MRSQTHYEAVQVVRRLDDGRMAEWWPGNKRATAREAREDAKEMARDYLGTEYQVITVTIKELQTFKKKEQKDPGEQQNG